MTPENQKAIDEVVAAISKGHKVYAVHNPRTEIKEPFRSVLADVGIPIHTSELIEEGKLLFIDATSFKEFREATP